MRKQEQREIKVLILCLIILITIGILAFGPTAKAVDSFSKAQEVNPELQDLSVNFNKLTEGLRTDKGILEQIELQECSLKQSLFGNKLHMTIKNKSKLVIKKLIFTATYKDPRRTLAYLKEVKLTYKPSGGVEVGEVIKVALTPHFLNKLFKQEIKPKAKLTLKVIGIIDSNDKLIGSN